MECLGHVRIHDISSNLLDAAPFEIIPDVRLDKDLAHIWHLSPSYIFGCDDRRLNRWHNVAPMVYRPSTDNILCMIFYDQSLQRHRLDIQILVLPIH